MTNEQKPQRREFFLFESRQTDERGNMSFYVYEKDLIDKGAYCCDWHSTPKIHVREIGTDIPIELVRPLLKLLKEARADERERIIEELGNPGLEGCGQVKVSTKYDKVISDFKKATGVE